MSNGKPGRPVTGSWIGYAVGLIEYSVIGEPCCGSRVEKSDSFDLDAKEFVDSVVDAFLSEVA